MRRRWTWALLSAPVLLAALALLLLHVLVAQLEPRPMAEPFAGRPMPTTHTLELGSGRRLHHAEAGREEGPLVVLIHGTPGRWRDFEEVMRDPVLTAEARVLAVDRLGWGGSAAGGLAPTLREQAAAIAAMLGRYPANRPVVLVGHSLGGAVAPQVAMDSPDLVDGLVIVAGSIDPALETTTWYQVVARLPLIRWAIPEPLARSNEELRPFRGELLAMLPRWSEVRCPVEVVHGEDDALVPAANADFAARVLTGAPTRIERIPGQGHLIPWERPERITGAVLRALQEIESARRARAPATGSTPTAGR